MQRLQKTKTKYQIDPPPFDIEIICLLLQITEGSIEQQTIFLKFGKNAISCSEISRQKCYYKMQHCCPRDGTTKTWAKYALKSLR